MENRHLIKNILGNLLWISVCLEIIKGLLEIFQLVRDALHMSHDHIVA